MSKLVVSTLVTLDGVIEDPGGFGSSAHGGWAGQYFAEEAAQRSLASLERSDYFLCGRHTYELFAKAWPMSSGPYADRLNAMPKLVASTTLAGELDWNATVLDGDPVAALTEIKRWSDGDIMMYGSPTLMRTLLRAGLVDELSLMVLPVVVGGGQRLFPEDGPMTRLELIDQERLSTGIAILRYRPA